MHKALKRTAAKQLVINAHTYYNVFDANNKGKTQKNEMPQKNKQIKSFH